LRPQILAATDEIAQPLPAKRSKRAIGTGASPRRKQGGKIIERMLDEHGVRDEMLRQVKVIAGQDLPEWMGRQRPQTAFAFDRLRNHIRDELVYPDDGAYDPFELRPVFRRGPSSEEGGRILHEQFASRVAKIKLKI
jgi:hypothetical protein